MGNETVLLVCAQFHGEERVCVCVVCVGVHACVMTVCEGGLRHAVCLSVCVFVFSDSVYKNKPCGIKCHFSCSSVCLCT